MSLEINTKIFIVDIQCTFRTTQAQISSQPFLMFHRSSSIGVGNLFMLEGHIKVGCNLIRSHSRNFDQIYCKMSAILKNVNFIITSRKSIHSEGCRFLTRNLVDTMLRPVYLEWLRKIPALISTYKES